MDKVPEDPSARLAFLERWARRQQEWLYADEIAPALAHGRELARVVAQARYRAGQLDSPAGVAAIPVIITKSSDLPVDRAAVFADLMANLRKHKWADPIVSECDERRYIAPNAVDLARRRRPGARWLLYMEDDVILGPDFGLIPELLREANERFPHAGIVSFFHDSDSEPGWSIKPMDEFIWLQCAAIRNTEHLGGFRTFIDDGVTQNAAKQWRPEIPDQALQAFMATAYDAHAVWCPSLVQHAQVWSVFWKNQNGLISKSYELAYG